MAVECGEIFLAGMDWWADLSQRRFDRSVEEGTFQPVSRSRCRIRSWRDLQGCGERLRPGPLDHGRSIYDCSSFHRFQDRYRRPGRSDRLVEPPGLEPRG